VYDGRKRQLKIPDDLRNIPAILSRYPGNIPYHSLVLMAYTVSMYCSAHGSRKDQPTVPLNISFAVVLNDKPIEFIGNEGSQDVDVVEEDGDEDGENQEDESMQISSAEEAEDQDDEEDDDQSECAEADLTDAAVDEHSDDE